MTRFGPPLEGRESAARRWRVAGFVVMGLGMAGGILAAVGGLFALPWVLAALGLAGLAIGIVGAFVVVVGLGWTTGLTWNRSLWLGLKAAGSAIRDLA